MKNMRYIKKEDNRMVKYDLIYNESEVKKLFDEVKNDLFVYEHKSYDSKGTVTPSFTRINVSCHKIPGEYHIDKESDVKYQLFHVEYDELTYKPRIASLIESFLDGSNEIAKYIDGRELLYDLDKINRTLAVSSKRAHQLLDEKKGKEAKKELDIIEYLEKKRKMAISELGYLQKLTNLITIHEVEAIDIDVYEYALSFTNKNA